MEWVFTREVVVGMAVLGALPSVAAGMLQLRGSIDEARARQLNYLGYGLMAVSMVLFVATGFRSH